MLTLLSVPAPAATPAPAVASPISSSAPPETLPFASALPSTAALTLRLLAAFAALSRY